MAGFPKGPTRRGETAKRPKPGIPFDKDQVASLINKYVGNVSMVADALGAARGSIRGFIDRHPDLVDLLKQTRERQLDQLEKAVFERAVESNDTTLQLFLLKTQGKSRGYEQSEAQNTAKDIATAAFDYILNKSKNPAEPAS